MAEDPSTVLRSLLNANTTPSHMQTEVLRQGIAELTQEQIPRARAQLQQLENQLVQYRWALSPLRHLPLETIGEIIHIAVPDFKEKGFRQKLLSYGLVCKSWWLAALLKHELWSRIRIHGPTYSQGDSAVGKPIFRKGSFNQIAAWLGRSGSLTRVLEVAGSRDLRTCAGHEGRPDRCPWLAPTLRKLLVKGPQLNTLHLARLGPMCLRRLMDAIHSSRYSEPRTLDRLASLSIVFTFDHTRWIEPSHENDPPYTLFADLPTSLTTLRISLPSVHGIGLDQFAHPIEIPAEVLNGLKTFEFNSDWGILHAPRLLLSCANLEYLSLNFRSRDPRFAPFEEEHLFEVHLPNLRTLRLQDQYFRLELLKFFRTPALEALDIGYEKILFRHCMVSQGFGGATLSPKIPLCDFVLRSGCQETLRSLRIYGFTVPLAAEDLEVISVDCPSLTHLTLDRVGLRSDEFFGSFQRNLAGCETPESIPPSCLPHLQQLQILDCPKKEYCSPFTFAFLRRLHHARGGNAADRIELVMSFAEGTGWEELTEEDFSATMEWDALDADGRKKRDPVVFKVVEAEYGNKNWADPDDDGVRSHPFARPLDLANIQFQTFTPVNHT